VTRASKSPLNSTAMTQSRGVSLPSSISGQYDLSYTEYLSTRARGCISYNGNLSLGEDTHPVRIEHCPVPDPGYRPVQDGLNELVSGEPLFTRPFLKKIAGNTLITVTERFECDIFELVERPEDMRRLPAWNVVRKCMLLMRNLHLNGFCHRSISATCFLIVDIGHQLEVKLCDFDTAAMLPSTSDHRDSLVSADLVQLRTVLSGFMAMVKLYQPDFTDERSALFTDLFQRMAASNAELRDDLEIYLSHPAVQPYEKVAAFAVSVANTLDPVVDENRFGYRLLQALDADSGADFVRWHHRFQPEVHKIHDDFRRAEMAAREGVEVSDLLDRYAGLQYPTRVFRNRVSHRASLVNMAIGEPPNEFTRFWVKRLPKMWIKLWHALIKRQLQGYFPEYFCRFDQ
jgi:hypothetical protein